MPRNDGYALFIGINEYSAYDASVGNPQGTSDLPGSCNDARMFWRVCLNLGFQPQNMRILTSAQLRPSDLEGATGVNIGAATADEIRRQIGWLADKVRGTTRGLLTYSGHGASREDLGLLICPTDVRGRDLQNAIPFAELKRALSDSDPGNLTVLLDCCFAGMLPEPTQRHLMQALVQHDLPLALRSTNDLQLSDRVLAACKVDQSTYQARFMGEFHGAFSWAVGSTLEQWQAVTDEGGTRLDLSYGELKKRVQALYHALSFPISPSLYGVDNVHELAFLQEGNAPLPTNPKPDGVRKAAQVDGGNSVFRKIVLKRASSTGLELGVIFVMNQTAGRFNAGYEYWYVDQSVLAGMGTNDVYISYTDESGTPSPPTYTSRQGFVVQQNPIGGWGSGWSSDPLSGAGKLYQNGSLDLRMQTTSAGAGLASVTYVAWYQVIPSSNSPANISPSGTFTYDGDGAVGVPGGNLGYDINQSA